MVSESISKLLAERELASLSARALGCFIRLADECHRSGSIVGRRDVMARACQGDLSEGEWQEIQPLFEERDGRLYCRLIESGRTAPVKRSGKKASIKSSSGYCTFSEYLAALESRGEMFIPMDDSIRDKAVTMRLPHNALPCVKEMMMQRYGGGLTQENKRYIDWRAIFRTAVVQNWFRLWWFDDTGEGQLTQVGRQTVQLLQARLAAQQKQPAAALPTSRLHPNPQEQLFSKE